MSLTRWIHEVKMYQIVYTKFLQLQNDRTQVGPQDLRVRVFLHLILISFLCVQSEMRLNRFIIFSLVQCKCHDLFI